MSFAFGYAWVSSFGQYKTPSNAAQGKAGNNGQHLH